MTLCDEDVDAHCVDRTDLRKREAQVLIFIRDPWKTDKSNHFFISVWESKAEYRSEISLAN